MSAAERRQMTRFVGRMARVGAASIELDRLATLASSEAPMASAPQASRLAADVSLRLLVKVADKKTRPKVEREINERLGVTRKSPIDGPVASTSIWPLGSPRSDGSCWIVVDLHQSLGSALRDIDYDRHALDDFVAVIAKIPGVIAAEVDLPSTNSVMPLQESIPGCTSGRDAAPADVDWAPRLVGLFDLPASTNRGAGVRIGHIDTGYTAHPELDASSYDLVNAASTIDASGGLDPMPGGTSHGTATGTILISAPGTNATNDLDAPSPGITGLAPGAIVVPVRALDAVVVVEAPIFTQSSIAMAIQQCIASGCHVISMSFGGVVSLAVRDALDDAFENHMILCAAAGNCVGFVVQPAALDTVIACGGVGIEPDGSVRTWPGTSAGPQIDISAPSDNVWVGDWIDGEARVRPGEGTSFAAPHVAGAAAIWLEHHGREALLARYASTGERLGDVFRSVVKSSALVPPGWDSDVNGAGVVNLPQLVAHPLPEPGDAATPAPSLDAFIGVIGTIIGGNNVDTSELIDIIPDFVGPSSVVVDLDHLTVRDDGEFWGGAEPYVMASYLVVDGTTSQITVELDVAEITSGNVSLHATLTKLPGVDSVVKVVQRGTHGNVDEVNIGPIELAAGGPREVDIPSSVGLFETELVPIPIRVILDGGDVFAGVDLVGLPGFVGVHAMLSEEDFTPSDAIESAHEVVGEGIAGIISDVLAELELSDLSVDPSAFVERIREIEDDAAQAAASEMNLWELFWGGVVDPDDQLIQIFSFVNALQIGSGVDLQDEYVGEHGDWIMVGEIREG